MPIEVANPTEGLEDADDLFEEEGSGTEYNMRELMDTIYKMRDAIFTVPNDQVQALKTGLIIRKGKDNSKLKKADISPASEVLSFMIYPAKKDGVEIPGFSDVRVKLGPKKSVTILDIRSPNDEF
jgi:hypothetical protein